MGKSWMFCVLVLAACQPMYGKAPQKLRSPDPVKSPDEPITVAPKLDYAEDCEFYTSKPAKPVVRQPTKAAVFLRVADKKLADYDAAPPAAKADLIVDTIDELAAALREDPYNAQATLKLAVAYDKVNRKGCALALLARLDQLAQNPKFAGEANDAIDEIIPNRKWFAGYRKDALRLFGRTSSSRPTRP